MRSASPGYLAQELPKPARDDATILTWPDMLVM